MTNESPRTLSDVCEFIVDCLHKTAPTRDEGYPSIRTPNVGRGRLLLDGVNRVSEETYQEWTRRGVPRADDLILAREAPAGNVAIVRNGQIVCLGQRTVHLRPDQTQVDPSFLCYYLLAPPQQGALLAGETGVTAGHVNMRDIRRLRVDGLPELHRQQRVGAILSAYDDLIENNRRRIALLERAARELYREWFVRLRFPGHEHTKIVDGVPEGWERLSFEECLVTHIGGGWGKDEPLGDETTSAYVIRGTDLAPVRRGEFSKVGLRFHKDSSLKNRLLRPGDIIFEVSGGSATQPVGRSILIGEELICVFGSSVMCASFCKKLVPESRVLGVYLHQHLEFIRQSGEMQIFQKQSASALQNFNFAAFLQNHLVSRPSESLLKAFADIASSLLKQQVQLAMQNHKLSRARDLLLPRLMSGEVAV